MKAFEKLQALSQQALQFGKEWSNKHPGASGGIHGDYPVEILDLVIFHKLHLSLPAKAALKGFRLLKEQFVDWNEVRISSVREIQEVLGLCSGSLELAVFIKDLLETVHRERQDVSLEFLAEKNLGEIREYLKQFRGMDNSTVEVLLRVRKEHPGFPLNHALLVVLTRIGILKRTDTRSQGEKHLSEIVEPGKTLLLHHFLLNHSRMVCPPDVEEINCSQCSMRRMCAFYARNARKLRGKAGRRGPGSQLRSPFNKKNTQRTAAVRERARTRRKLRPVGVKKGTSHTKLPGR